MNLSVRKCDMTSRDTLFKETKISINAIIFLNSSTLHVIRARTFFCHLMCD